MASHLPLVLPPTGEDPRQLPAGDCLKGGGKWLPLLTTAGAGLSVAAAADLTLSYTEFVWEDALIVPGHQLYLEVNGSVSLATSPLQVLLVTPGTGATAAGASLTLTNLSAGRFRSAAFSLTAGGLYVVRVKCGTLGAATLSTVRLLSLP